QALRSETELKDKLANSLEHEQEEAYLHRIALANRELAADNLRRARELLEECPDDKRDWEWRCLKRLCEVNPVVIRDKSGINSVAFDAGGERIASACGDGSLKVWDSKTGRNVGGVEHAHRGFASSVAFHPGGNHLASVGFDRQVKVW